MNNKGFAITSIIYGLMLLFVVVITSFLSILVGRNRRMDELIEGVYDSVKYETNTITVDDFVDELDNKVGIEAVPYVTDKRGLYKFDINGEKCDVFLPKSVIIVAGAFKNPSDDANKNKLYYFYSTDGGGSDLEAYNELVCLK